MQRGTKYVPSEPLTTVWKQFQLLECCFLGALDGGKCLQTESLTNFIRIHSVIRCICKIVKSDYHLQHVCLLGMAQLPIGVFS